MGSFNMLSCVSQLPIHWGDKIKIFVLKKNHYGDKYLACYSCTNYCPITFPINGEYYDYGQCEYEKGVETDMLESIFNKDIDTIMEFLWTPVERRDYESFLDEATEKHMRKKIFMCNITPKEYLDLLSLGYEHYDYYNNLVNMGSDYDWYIRDFQVGFKEYAYEKITSFKHIKGGNKYVHPLNENIYFVLNEMGGDELCVNGQKKHLYLCSSPAEKINEHLPEDMKIDTSVSYFRTALEFDIEQSSKDKDIEYEIIKSLPDSKEKEELLNLYFDSIFLRKNIVSEFFRGESMPSFYTHVSVTPLNIDIIYDFRIFLSIIGRANLFFTASNYGHQDVDYALLLEIEKERKNLLNKLRDKNATDEYEDEEEYDDGE